MKKIAARLDVVSNTLEQKGLVGLASSLDVIANTLEEGEVTELVQKGLETIKSKRSLLQDPDKAQKLLAKMLNNPKMVDLAQKWVAKHPNDAEKLSEKIEAMSPGHDLIDTLGTVKCASLFNSLRGVKRGVLIAVLLAMGSAYAGGGTSPDLPNTQNTSGVSYDGGTPTLESLEKSLVSFTEGGDGHDLFQTLHSLTKSNPDHSMDGEILKVIHKHLPPDLAQRLVKTFDLKENYSRSFEEATNPDDVGALLTKHFKAGETKVINSFKDVSSAEMFRYNTLGSNFEKGLHAKGLTMSIMKSGQGFDLVVHPEDAHQTTQATPTHDTGAPDNLAKIRGGLSHLFGKA